MHKLQHHTPYDDAYWRWLKDRIYKERFRWVFVLVMNFVGVGIALLQPIPMKLLADSVFGDQKAVWPLGGIQNNTTLLVAAASLMLAVVIVNGVYSMGGGLLQQRIQSKLDVDVQRELLESILRTPIRSQSRASDGEYQFMVNNLSSTVSEFIYDTTVTICRSIVFIIVMTVVIFIINPWLALITIVAMPFIYVNVRKFNAIFERQSEAIVKQQGEQYDLIDMTIAQNRLIQQNSTEDGVIGRYVNTAVKTNLMNRRYAIMVALFNFSNDIITSVTTSLLVLVGGMLVFGGHLSFGDLLIFLTYIGMLYDPLQELSVATGDYPQKKVKISTVYKAIIQGKELALSRGTTKTAADYSIEFEHVTLSYRDHTVLDDISFAVPAGKKLGLIGASGSGKSTLLDVLLRLSAVDRGFIRLGGTEIKDWDVKALKAAIAIVDQDPQIVDGTVLDNILYGTKLMYTENSLPEAMKAAKIVNALEFIETMPDKFMTIVGSQGVHLSGGQAQRICLARALVKDTPVLLLDEPTSALDEGSRRVVTQAIKNVMKNKTVIVSTHDYELLSATDFVIAVKDGRLYSVQNKEQLAGFVAQLEAEAKVIPTIGDLSVETL